MRYMEKPEITDINEVKERAEKKHSHFFDADTIRFFKSRPSFECYKVKDDIYFITSERRDHTVPRFWTNRKVDLDGNIETVGKFQDHSSLREARKALLDFLGDRS